MPQLALSFLGGFDATLAGAACTGFESNKVRALLVFLALEPDRAHTRAALAGLLWPEQPEPTARKNLRDALFNLRKVIGNDAADPPFVSVSRGELQFNLESDHTLDAIQFNALLTASSAHPHRRLDGCRACAQRLAEAAALYRGDLLAGLFVKESAAFEDWLYIKREYFREQALQALQVLASFHERRREYAQAIGYARRQLELAPWDEAAHGRLMRNLAANGERAAALEQYARCCQRLAEELGVEPAAETVALYESIRDQGTTERYDGASHSRPFVPKQNLPVQATPFEGRSAELLQIGEQLNHPDCRLLTLVGAGGVGKTRLALQAAADEIHNYQDGVWFVALAGVATTGRIPSAIADALGFRFEGSDDPAAQLLQHLRDQEMLLVLDNFEHLVAGATFVGELLAAAPNVQILATSRERLQLRWEWLLPVRGMNVPAAERDAQWEEHDATRLFVHSTRRVRLDFAPTPADARAIARICRLLEGLPLGIELSAALVQYNRPAEVLTQIEHNLTRLSTSLRDVPARHRSLTAVCDQSWQLLSEAEREVFQRLSVFRGGFQREAAERIAGASLATISALVDKSFIRRTPAGRYEIHEMLLEFAEEKLARVRATLLQTQARHAHYYAAFLSDKEAGFSGSQQSAAGDAVRREISNVQAGWHWAVANKEAEVLCQALESLTWFYELSGQFREGEDGFGRAVRALQGSKRTPEIRCLGRLMAFQGYFSQSLGFVAAARRLLAESLEICRPLGDERTVAFVLWFQARISHIYDGYIDAHMSARLHESLEIYRRCDDQTGMARCLNLLGLAARGIGELDDARAYLKEGVAIARVAGNLYTLGPLLGNLGYVAYQQGEFERAAQYGHECLQNSQNIGYRHGIGASHGMLGRVYTKMGKSRLAIAHLEDALDVLGAIKAMDVYLEFKLDLSRAHRLRDEWQQARTLLLEALQSAEEYGFTMEMSDGLQEMAHHLYDAGSQQQALALLAIVLHHPVTTILTKAEAQALQDRLEDELPQEEFSMAVERGQSQQLEDVIPELLAELTGDHGLAGDTQPEATDD